MKVTDDLEITVKDKWIEILSYPDDQFISVGFDEIDPLIEILKIAKTRFADAPDKLLKYAELIQVFENEIKWCVANQDKGSSPEYSKGFIYGLMQAKYLVNELAHLNKKVPGYMGDIGGTPYGPSDRDADYLGECTCGMGAGTIAPEEHAESCPMSNKDWYQFPGRFIE